MGTYCHVVAEGGLVRCHQCVYGLARGYDQDVRVVGVGVGCIHGYYCEFVVGDLEEYWSVECSVDYPEKIGLSSYQPESNRTCIYF